MTGHLSATTKANPGKHLYFVEPNRVVEAWKVKSTFHAIITNNSENNDPEFVFETLEHLREVMGPRRLWLGPPIGVGGNQTNRPVIAFGTESSKIQAGLYAKLREPGESETPRQVVVREGEHTIWLPMPNGVTKEIALKAFNVTQINFLTDAKFRRLRSLASSPVNTRAISVPTRSPF